jgi:phospholipase A-2-activating protein
MFSTRPFIDALLDIGASRHRPSASTVSSTSAYSDPFTGGSRYISNESATTPPTASSSYSDPFTGSNRYLSGPSTAPMSPSPAGSVIPVVGSMEMRRENCSCFWQSKALLFKQANVSAMQGKLYQFDQALRSEIVRNFGFFGLDCLTCAQSTSALALYPEEIDHLEEVFTFLAQSATERSPTVNLTNSHVETVVQILERWPASQRFPGTRCIARSWVPKLKGFWSSD